MDINNKTTAVRLHQAQRRGIWLTVTGCLIFISILLGLFFHKITTPRYLSIIELRINGLILLEQPQLLSALQSGEAVAEQLPPGKWSLLVIHRGYCGAVCIERITLVTSMLGQLQPAYREKTQLTLIADDTAELLAIINKASQHKIRQENIQSIVINSSQRQAFEKAINFSTADKLTAWPKIIIVDDTGHYRGYFTTPFDANKMLLTYSSIMEHR